MHKHNLKEITESLQEDDFLHIFECKCGFTIIEKKRLVKTIPRQKKITIYTIVRK